MKKSQISIQRSKSMQKFQSKSTSRLASPEKSKEKYRTSIKALRSSKFSQLFTKQSHNDTLLLNYRDFRFTSKQKKLNSASSFEGHDIKKHPSKKILIQRQKTLENFNDLIEKCKIVRSTVQSSQVVEGCKKINVDLGRLKKNIEKIQVDEDSRRKIHSKTEKMLRKDSRRLRNQIEFSERKNNKKCCIWKQRSGFLNRKTDKLIADIAIRLRHNEFE